MTEKNASKFPFSAKYTDSPSRKRINTTTTMAASFLMILLFISVPLKIFKYEIFSWTWGCPGPCYASLMGNTGLIFRLEIRHGPSRFSADHTKSSVG
jgi:hypothetical protein